MATVILLYRAYTYTYTECIRTVSTQPIHDVTISIINDMAILHRIVLVTESITT